MKKKKEQIIPEIKLFKLTELKPAEYNPRTISDDALEGMSESIKL